MVKLHEGECGLTYPMISPEVRESVYEHHIPSPEILTQTPHTQSRNSNTNIRDKDIRLIRSLEIGTIVSKIKMRSRPPGINIHSRQGEVVDRKVNRKRNQLMEE